MRVFTVFRQKASAEAFFFRWAYMYSCTAYIHVQCTVPIVYMTVRTQACFCKGLLNFFCSEILVSDLKMYNLTSFCFAGTKIRIINLVFSVSLKKE